MPSAKDQKTVTLPSGATLEIHLVGMEPATALSDAIFEELRGVKVGHAAELLDLGMYKDVVTALLPSKKVREVLKPCLAKSLYNGESIRDMSLFEPAEARQDWYWVQYHVLEFNLSPFAAGLFAKLPGAMRLFGQEILTELLKRPELVEALSKLAPVQRIFGDLKSWFMTQQPLSSTDSSKPDTAASAKSAH